ncbi:MAG: sensor domain-containing diguanylate cyclase [Azonexus sp.]|nr:sensor domain-containing diguanylate cyclase [Azonexus sp.]MCK6412222.1 sensor domain-containing diguanylate cyclase [Azonexus sp.]
MSGRPRFFNQRRSLLLLLSLLLGAGFIATALFGYYSSRAAIRNTLIGQDLPLTSSNIYSEIQKDLIRPILISSTMASDTFLRDWVLNGERDADAISRYLSEIRSRYGAFSSYFISDKTRNYYTANGILRQVEPQEQRDAWYARVRVMQPDYEINVDLDYANRNALTIFINYRVYDYNGRYLGIAGIGLTVEAVRTLIADYEKRFRRSIYFVDAQGEIVLGSGQRNHGILLRDIPGLRDHLDSILGEASGSYQYTANGEQYILHMNYLPELKWRLFVELNEDVALADIRQTLLFNLLISLGVTVLIVGLSHLTLARYHRHIEQAATTDKLTGLLNRHAASALVDKLLGSQRRSGQPFCFLLADLDHFKQVNDRHGHSVGDEVLRKAAAIFRQSLRASDFAVRWGGEEFLLVLQDCDGEQGLQVAEKIRTALAEASLSTSIADLHATVSIGVSEYRPGENPEQTLSRADLALYRAKNAGRNQVAGEDTAVAEGIGSA